MKKTIFNIVFLLLFLFGGMIEYFGIFHFRPSFLFILPLFLIPLYGIKLNKITFSFVFFFFFIVFSGLINGSSINQIIVFSARYVILPYGMYYLVSIHVSRKNIKKIIRLMIFIGIIQLPVVLIQRFFYDQIVRFTSIGISNVDITFGTFYVKEDYAMSIFLISLIIFLLFENKFNLFIKNRYFLSAYFTLTVLLSNSMICHLIVIGVWGVYLMRSHEIKSIIRLIAIGFITLSALFYFNYAEKWQNMVAPTLAKMALKGDVNNKQFYSGGYARVAAVLYYLDQPMELFGDGPGKYYDPISEEYTLGNQGQVLTFYAEIGIFGLIMGFIVLYNMVRTSTRSRGVRLLYFSSLVILAIPSSVLSNSSIILAFNLIQSTNKIRE